MDYKECSHYFEILKMLSQGRDFEDISFEIDDIKNCKECCETNGVCELWITLSFVENMKPQMNISDAKVTIDNLDEQMSKIVLQLARNVNKNNDGNI